MKLKSLIIKSVLSATLAVMMIPAMAQTKVDRSKKPVAGPAPKVQIGKIESFIMPNGLKVFVVENHKLPKVSYSIQLNLDPIQEGNIKGYSEIMASLMGTATKTRSKDQINKEIDFIGGNLSASSEGIYASSLKKHNEKLLEIMSDVLLNPVFKEEELDKVKKQTLSGLQASKNTPEAMAANISGIMNYGKTHPYGEVTTEESVEKVSLSDCQSYYETYFKPNVAYLAIVGDITLEEAKKLTEKYFGTWRKGDVPKSSVPEIVNPSSTKVIFVPRPNSVQSSIHITYPIDLKPGSPDEMKVRVLNEILGGGASARLFRNLRETYNLTYGAYSTMASDEYAGHFEAYAEVRTSGTDSAVNEFMKEINRIRAEKVEAAELQGVINAITGKFSISLENPATIARFAINIDKYNLPKDYYEKYLTELSKITIEDVYATAQKYIRPENAYIVVVGDRDKMPDFINRWKGKNAIEYYDQYGNPFKETKPVPEGLTAEGLYKLHINAIGGEANIRKVKSKVVKMSADIQGYKIEIISKKLYPKKKGLCKTSESVILNGAMLAQKKVFDGTKGKMSGMAGESMIEGEELEAAKLEAEPYLELRYMELGYKLSLIGVDEIEGADAIKMAITDPKGKVEYQWYDAKTYFLVKTESTTETPQGPMTATSYLSDYKEVNGVKYAHKIKTEAGPQIMDLNVTSIEINPKLDPKDFEIK
ncbi:MAG: insulinase family protein [Flavobacteriales bacterium]|nr:insulinase family protein [Flavobacteriales bacterium]